MWSLEGNLPTGLNLSESGIISGTPTDAGTFTFIVKVTNNDGSDTKPLSVTIDRPTSSEEIPDTPLTLVYPNPTDGAITLQFETAGEYMITVSDTTGKVLIIQAVTEQTARLDMSNYPSGVYLLTIDNGKRQSTTRVIKN